MTKENEMSGSVPIPGLDLTEYLAWRVLEARAPALSAESLAEPAEEVSRAFKVAESFLKIRNERRDAKAKATPQNDTGPIFTGNPRRL